MDKDTYLTTGEVAKIMNVTKNTLFHYDQLGIFSPIEKGSNDYRYYSITQLDVLDTILTLRDLDVPLPDIRNYLANRSPKQYQSLLEEELSIINRQMHKLNRRKKWILNQQTQLSLSSDVSPLEVGIMVRPHFYLAKKALLDNDSLTMSKALGKLVADYYKEHDISNYSILYAQKETTLTKGIYDAYCEVALAMRVSSKGMQCEHITSANYLYTFHQGYWDSIGLAYERLLSYKEEHSLHTDTCYYEECIIDNRMTDDTSQYLTRITVRIL